MKILILSCGTGEGHNSAAKAVYDNLKGKNTECEIRDVLSFKSERAARRAAEVYSAVIKRAPLLFGAAYVLGGLYDRAGLPSPIYYSNAKYAEKLCGYITSNGFDCVICTHLFAMEAMTAVRREWDCGVRVYGVLTDYTAIPFYKDCVLDGWFVPDGEAAGQLEKSGIPRRIIYRTGIPVREKFCAELTRDGAREALGLPKDKKIVAVTAGGAGCGRLLKLCKGLDKALDGDCVIAVFPARNNALEARLLKRFGGGNRFLIVGYTEAIHLYFKAADVVMTKPGGLSSTEAAALRVPIVHLKAIPGCETANAKYFAKRGLSVRTRTVKSAVRAAQGLLAGGDCTRNMLELQQIFINPRAAELITGKIEEEQNGRVALDSAYCGGLACGRDNVLQLCPEADNG